MRSNRISDQPKRLDILEAILVKTPLFGAHLSSQQGSYRPVWHGFFGMMEGVVRFPVLLLTRISSSSSAVSSSGCALAASAASLTARWMLSRSRSRAFTFCSALAFSFCATNQRNQPTGPTVECERGIMDSRIHEAPQFSTSADQNVIRLLLAKRLNWLAQQAD
jgi:hypothetical protein